MRRYASELLHELQVRVARLERISEKRYTKKDIEKHFEDAGRLSNVDPVLSKILVGIGDRDLDKIPVRKETELALRLKPSQTTMVLEASVGLAFQILLGNMDNEMGAIVSADNHILDGHHRWSAWIIAKGHENPKVSFYKADLKGSMLIRVLNIATKGFFVGRNGNKGEGSISEYTPNNLEKILRRFIAEGRTGEHHPMPPSTVRNALIDHYGSIEGGVAQMKRNILLMSKEVPSWAPDRIDMPVIKGREVPEVAKALSRGEVEWAPPYPSEVYKR